MKCLNCEKTVKQTEGKRPKSYCDSSCRQKHWQKKNKEAHPPARKPGRPKKEKKPPILLTVTEIDNVIMERDGLTAVRQEPVELVDKEAIQTQISQIKAEKIPDHRNKSIMGRRSWEGDQKKRIKELEIKINANG